nr:MAG TPA: hypothetical protein [Caudoviricetes sp.]
MPNFILAIVYLLFFHLTFLFFYIFIYHCYR